MDLTTSDYIALVAAVAAIIALYPQFALLTREKSKKPNSPTESPATSTAEEPSKPQKPRKLNPLGKALVLASCGLSFGVIEIVYFSLLANWNDVAVNVQTMPIHWLVVFYALFVIPGIFLFWAAAHLFNLFEDPKRRSRMD